MKTTMCRELIKANTGAHRDVASVFILMYGHLFSAFMLDGKLTIKHRRTLDEETWVDSDIHHIKHNLSTGVSAKFFECSRLCFSKAFNDKNQLIKPNYVTVAMNLVKIGNLLKNQTYKNHISKEIIEMLVQK